MKKIFVKDLVSGDEIFDTFMVNKQIIKATTSGGKPYLTLKLEDKTGTIDAKVWNNADKMEARLKQFFEEGETVFTIDGTVSSFNRALQVKINSLNTLKNKTTLDLSLFEPERAFTPSKLQIRLKRLIDQIDDPGYKAFISELMSNPQYEVLWQHYLIGPAAVKVHHAYKYGLLQHSVGVTEMAVEMFSHYVDMTVDTKINKSLIIIGGLMHDIGKVLEISLGGEMTAQGKLLGHLCLGIGIVSDLNKRQIITPEQELHLKHIIASHHGKIEFGVIREPQTIEARILFHADYMDSQAAQYSEIEKKRKDDEDVWVKDFFAGQCYLPKTN